VSFTVHFLFTMTRLSAGMNIGAHKEAAEHLLSALASQDVSRGEKSEQLWFTLRRNFMEMVRIDCQPTPGSFTEICVVGTA
jgi:peroxin-5